MTKIDNFKSFVRRNPNLITYVREKNTSWQEFYELYDLYGEDPTIWNKYLNKEEKGAKESSNNNPLNNILTMAKNIDADKLQDPDYIARYAREKYSYSKDGEIILRIP